MTRPCSSRKRYTPGEVGIDPGRGRRWGCAVMLPLWSHPPTDGQSRASPHLRIRPDVTIRYPDVLGCAGTRRLLKGNSSVDLLQWAGILVSVLIAMGLVSIVHWLLTHQLSKVWRLAQHLVARCRVSAYVAAAVVGVNISMPSRSEMADRSLYAPLLHALEIAMIIGLTWLATSIAYAITDGVLARLSVSNGDADRRSRRLQTQVRLMRRIVTGTIVVSATPAALVTLQAVRPLGAGLLTSAGLSGHVPGIAAPS